MKVVVIYRPVSEYARQVEEYVHDFKQAYQDIHLDLLDIDSREGWSTASLYDVTRYPAILVLSGDGSLLKSWEGIEFPLMNEIVGYAYA